MSPYLPSKQANLEKAKLLRANMTPAERKLWYDFLRFQKPRWARQKPLLDYVVDFYCNACTLVIEVDGESHDSPEASQYDERRTRRLGVLGIRVLRFTNTDVLENFEVTCMKITVAVKKQKHTSLLASFAKRGGEAGGFPRGG